MVTNTAGDTGIDTGAIRDAQAPVANGSVRLPDVALGALLEAQDAALGVVRGLRRTAAGSTRRVTSAGERLGQLILAPLLDRVAEYLARELLDRLREEEPAGDRAAPPVSVP